MVSGVRRSPRLATTCMSSVLLGLLALAGPACAPAHQGYIEWRPGLSPSDFDGTFEISLDEYERFDDEGEAYLVLDRRRGAARPDAGDHLAALGQAVEAAGGVDSYGLALRSLDREGKVVVAEPHESDPPVTPVDWFARSADGRFAALLTGSTLAVYIDGASAGIDLGRLLGAGADGYHLAMSVGEDELTVFALPEIGGAVTAFEAGYLVSFRYEPGAREVWDVTVARISITM